MVIRREGPEEASSPKARGLEAHRRAKREAESVSLPQALAWETARTWPGWRLRRAFWRSERVPERFRNEPDPRPTLMMDQDERRSWRERRDEWEAARLQWLEEAAGEVDR